MGASRTWASLRQIMYQPSVVWLATEYSGDRWLTDQYVMLLVTDWGEFAEMPDGPYRLTVSNGPQPNDAVPEPDIEGWFGVVSKWAWKPAEPTEWSVAEHPGKAMLWASEGRPCLLGEPTWTALKRHYPDVVVEHSFDGASMFRFSECQHIDIDDDCMAGECGCQPIPFAYAAGIRCPDGQEGIAERVVAA